MRIPKRCQLLGHTITVRVVSKRDWEAVADENDIEDAVGLWVPADALILVKRQTKSMMLHTYMHELMHAVLYYMNHKLYHDEVFVDNSSGLLAQALETAE